MKILLLHGWNNDNYTKKTKERDAWHNRSAFVDELSKFADIYKLNFPGFCGEEEPKGEWDLDDFAFYVKDYLNKNNLTVDYILGYSFGGAVAVKYNRLIDSEQKIILVSPAIIRKTKNVKKFINTPSILMNVRKAVRNMYLKHIVKNEYMIDGTKFLNNTYQNIVRVDLLDELNKIDSDKVLVIYGNKDSMVLTSDIKNNVSDSLRKRINIIDGDHDIANTNTEELINIIKKDIM